MKSLFLSVVIPCYNEETRLKEGYSHFTEYLKKQKYDWELVMVNDGSKDSTEKILKLLSRKNKNLKIVSYKRNRGKGYAVSKGIEAAKGNYILFSDLDHSVSIDFTRSFINHLENGFDIVIASRRVKGATLKVRQKPFREFLGRSFTVLVRILIDPKIKDATCGFKMYRKNTAKNLFKRLTVFDWVFDAEILFLSKKYNFKIAQLPVVWEDAKGSKVKLAKDVISSLKNLIKIRLNDLQGKYEKF